MDHDALSADGRFTGQALLPMPKFTTPSNVLEPMKRMGPVIPADLLIIPRAVINQGLQELTQPKQKTRMDRHHKIDRFHVYLGRLLVIASEQELELWFVTIDLAQGESHISAIDNFYKHQDHKRLWVGAYIPQSRRVPCQEHIHLIVAIPIEVESISRLVSFETHRNAIKGSTVPNSVKIRWVYNLTGLRQYFCLWKNLGVRGAKPIACNGVKSIGRSSRGVGKDAP